VGVTAPAAFLYVSYMTMEENINIQEPQRAPWWQYALIALALIIVMFLLSVIRTRDGEPMRQTQSDLSYIYEGDLQVKLHLLQQFAEERGVQNAASQPGEQPIKQAKNLYQQAAKRPNPSAIRRAGVLTYELKGKNAVQILSRLDDPQVLNGLPERDQEELRAEARMWQDIYAGEVTPEEVEAYRERIERLSMGPVRAFALEHLYQSVGREQEANEVLRSAGVNAAISIIGLGLLFLGLFAAGILGIVFLILFFNNKNRWLGTTEPKIETGAAGRETLPSSLLFQGFIVYISVILLLTLIAGITAAPILENLPAENRLLYVVLLQLSLSVISGMFGLGVLYLLARSVGKDLRAIGLTSRELGRNILWGAAGYCALLPLLLIAGLIANLISRSIETPAHPLIPMLMKADAAVFLLLLVTGVLLAPFFEEIFFRGVLYNALRTRFKFWAAVIISGAAFAIVHPQLPAGFIAILVIGALFAVLFEIRGSLVPSMVAHALNNGMIFLMMYLIFMI